MRGLLSDIRYALRTLRRGRIAIVVAVLSLAAGVGSNVAIFSVGYAMLAHPLPFPGADRLVMLRPMNPSHGMFFPTVAPANLLDWQAQAKSFEAVAGYRWRSVDLTGGDRSERLRGLSITPEFFQVLAVPLRGETFGPNDPRRRRYKIILGRRLWLGHRYQRAGLEGVLYEKQRPGAAEVLDTNQKQRIIAMVCSEPPEGRSRWTVRLVAVFLPLSSRDFLRAGRLEGVTHLDLDPNGRRPGGGCRSFGRDRCPLQCRRPWGDYRHDGQEVYDGQAALHLHLLLKSLRMVRLDAVER